MRENVVIWLRHQFLSHHHKFNNTRHSVRMICVTEDVADIHFPLKYDCRQFQLVLHKNLYLTNATKIVYVLGTRVVYCSDNNNNK